MKLWQPRKGYRFSVDAPLLASFVRIKGGERVIELGSGNGVILLLLATRAPRAREMVGLEIQREMVKLAEENVLLNGYEGLIRMVHGDIRECKRLFAPESFDLVLSNPPYHPVGRGRVSLLSTKAVARHEIFGGIEDILRASRYLLKGGGRAYYIYPSRRAATLLALMRSFKLEPKLIRWVHPSPGEGAKMLLVEGVKGASEGLEVSPPLYIHGEGGEYTEETRRILYGGRR